jgi:hypothetical protein
MIVKVRDHADGYRITHRQYGTVTIELTGRRGRMRGRGQWHDYTLTIDIENLRKLLAEAEAAHPEKLLAKATATLPTPERWGPYTPIEWLDGRAVTVAREDAISADATTDTINWGKAVLDDYVQAEYGEKP